MKSASLFFFLCFMALACQNQKPGEEPAPTEQQEQEKPLPDPFEGTDWSGKYHCVESFKDLQGEPTIVIAHSLDIKKEGQDFLAELNSDGYQTMNRLLCRLQAQGKDSSALLFVDYGEGDLFQSGYQADELLYSLKRISATEIHAHYKNDDDKDKVRIFKVLKGGEELDS